MGMVVAPMYILTACRHFLKLNLGAILKNDSEIYCCILLHIQNVFVKTCKVRENQFVWLERLCGFSLAQCSLAAAAPLRYQ